MFYITHKHGLDRNVYRVLSVQNRQGQTKFLIYKDDYFEWVYADYYRLVEEVRDA